MQINYGLVAAVQIDRFHVEIVHFCGYEQEPTDVEIQALEEELQTDPQFDLVGRDDYIIVPTTEDMVDFYRRVHNGEDPNECFFS